MSAQHAEMQMQGAPAKSADLAGVFARQVADAIKMPHRQDMKGAPDGAQVTLESILLSGL